MKVMKMLGHIKAKRETPLLDAKAEWTMECPVFINQPDLSDSLDED